MPGKAAKLHVTERQMDLLEEMVASRTAVVRLVQRAQLVLLAFRPLNNEEVGELVGLNPQQVSVGRKRWKADWERLIMKTLPSRTVGPAVKPVVQVGSFPLPFQANSRLLHYAPNSQNRVPPLLGDRHLPGFGRT